VMEGDVKCKLWGRTQMLVIVQMGGLVQAAIR
jgi:hypothetical protein